MNKTCPVCNTAFHNEEFCPVHFVALVTPLAAHDPRADPEPMEQPGMVEVRPPADNSYPAGEESLLDRITKRLGDRFKKKASAPPTFSDASPPKAAEKAEIASIELPSELRETGWVINGQPATQNGIDVWPAQRENGGLVCNGQLVVHAAGVLTDLPTYRHLLEQHASPTRARLHAFGTLDRGHRVRASYELLTTPDHWQSLSAWLADSPPSEERALSLLPGLHALMADWCETGVIPICLDPSVLQRDGEGRLRLMSFGALCSTTADSSAAVYRPEFARSALLPAPWSAPEVKGRLVVAPQSVVFSQAQVLAAALFGHPLSQHDVQMGLVPFPSIRSPELARLLMGGLWPQAEGRWNLSQWRDALRVSTVAQMPPAPAWSRLMPGAAENAFDLGGESFYRLEDAVAQANQPRHWDEAIQRLDPLLLWASGTAWKGVTEGLRSELTTGTRSADWVLVRLTRQVRPDLPLIWRGLDFSDTHAQASLAAVAQQALTSDTPDFAVLRQLVRADLRGAFTVPN